MRVMQSVSVAIMLLGGLAASGQQTTPIPATVLAPGSTLPAKAFVGQPFQFDLAIGRRGTFEIIEGPKGLMLTRPGVLMWRPSTDAVGTHEIKVKLTFDKTATELHRYRIVVEPASVIANTNKGSSPNCNSGSNFGGRVPPAFQSPEPIPFEKLPIIRQFFQKKSAPPAEGQP